MAIATGARFNHYEIIAPLGAGGMGEVWRARDTRLNREVAIKVLPASFAQDADRLLRFKQEALATSALNHPNILTVHDIGDHEGAPFIVVELLEGEELREQLKDGALPVRTAIDYAQQIASGLAAAHAKGIVHRDLKPENLFITADGRLKILDFGLAKLKPPNVDGIDTDAPTQKKITDPGAVLGTVGYMAPEQVRGQEADHRADIFSFGVILYEMLSARRAFSGDSAIEVMNAILKEDPPELTATNTRAPQGLERLIRRCLEKKPEQRFHSAHDLGYALEALSSSSGARLETAGAGPSRLFGPVRLAWAVAAALLLVTLGLTWAYFTRQPVSDVRVSKTSILPPEKSSFDQIAMSPDGRHLAFTAATGGKVQIWVRALDSTEAKSLAGTQGATYPFWSPDSRFIGFFADSKLKKIEFTRDGALLARPFDAHRLDFTGEPFTLSDKVGSYVVPGGYSTFSVSDNGVLVFDPSLTRQRRQYLWMDRRGQPIKSLDVAAGIYQHWLSPDEKRFIAGRLDTQTSPANLWVFDLSGGTPARFTFDRDVWVLPATGSGEAKPFQALGTEANEMAGTLSPDGRWLAYASDESGRVEVYVQSFPEGGGKRQVSNGGGHRSTLAAVWAGVVLLRGGREADGDAGKKRRKLRGGCAGLAL